MRRVKRSIIHRKGKSKKIDKESSRLIQTHHSYPSIWGSVSLASKEGSSSHRISCRDQNFSVFCGIFFFFVLGRKVKEKTSPLLLP
ncbi:hypothetical protein CSUI_006977 [Cystoisospora suis]|uniref:Uncharacterized protein n=1 Tax=Cystoisospora suis TaxID=483139 RepID=A0A2C6KNS8_9APIC|nr:hypothetical protein CSUI_006977 [Cystoisospora suis]